MVLPFTAATELVSTTLDTSDQGQQKSCTATTHQEQTLTQFHKTTTTKAKRKRLDKARYNSVAETN
eukprot:2839698-Amphidinium_carterae.2